MSQRHFEHVGTFLRKTFLHASSTAYSVAAVLILVMGGSMLGFLLFARGFERNAVLLGFAANLGLLLFLLHGGFMAYRDERRTREALEATTYDLTSNLFRHRDVRIQDLASARASAAVSGFVFEDCEIRGPALLNLHDDCTLIDSRVKDGPGFGMQAIWEAALDPTKYEKTGCLEVKACRFLRCTFVDIGISASPDFLAQLKNQLQRAGNGRVSHVGVS